MLSKTSPQIFVNGRFLTRRLTGVDRYAMEILRAIDEKGECEVYGINPSAITVVVPKWYSEPSPFRRIRLHRSGRLRGQAWEQLCLPFIARHVLLVNFCNTAPILKRKQVVVIHDAATIRHPRAFSPAFRWWYRFLLPLVGKLSARVVVPSQFTARELAECFHIPMNRMTVAPNSADHVLRVTEDKSVLTRHGLTDRRFVLAVGTRAPYKNFGVLEYLATKLHAKGVTVVSTGGNNEQVFGKTGETNKSHVLRTGYVTDEELVALYSAAECFVFPSLYEGFGIPPLEAMTLGCPVVCSDAFAMREVLEDAVIYFDGHNTEALVDAVDELLCDHDRGLLLADRGRVRARGFSWEVSAKLLLRECGCVIGT